MFTECSHAGNFGLRMAEDTGGDDFLLTLAEAVSDFQ